jgi:hypothetical protein
MVKEVRAYLNREKRDIMWAILTMVIVSLVYLAYLYLVGVPMTKAKNYYNQALLLYEEKNYIKAQEAVTNSLHYFTQQETLDLQKLIDAKK